MPMASVEIEGTDSLEIQMMDRSRKFSFSQAKHTSGSRKRSNTIDTTESIPLYYVKAANERFFKGMMVENGLYKGSRIDNVNGFKKQPPNNAPSYRAKYITLQHKDKTSPEELRELNDATSKDAKNKITHL